MNKFESNIGSKNSANRTIFFIGYIYSFFCVIFFSCLTVILFITGKYFPGLYEHISSAEVSGTMIFNNSIHEFLDTTGLFHDNSINILKIYITLSILSLSGIFLLKKNMKTGLFLFLISQLISGFLYLILIGPCFFSFFTFGLTILISIPLSFLFFKVGFDVQS